jgi:demethylmenaquinone methyltransferase/2-methoxy-6-polyprenyl-1,4-benzoquinol methylase
MLNEKPIWLNRQKRQHLLGSEPEDHRSTYFGFEQIPEEVKEDRVRQHFNSVASYYDFMNTILSFGIHYLWKQKAVRLLNVASGEWLLDLCGGTGDLALKAARAVGKSGGVVLYDINWDMMAAGRSRIQQSVWGKRIFYTQGNAEQIALMDSSVDSAMVGFGIRNVTHMEKGFAEMYRVLKPGGKMLCLEFSKPNNPVFRCLYDFYSFYIMPILGQVIAGSRKAYTHLPESIRMFPLPDELSALLMQIGFSEVRYWRLTNGIAVIHLAIKGEG